MKLDNIRVVFNGFVLEDSRGTEYVAKSLTEAAVIAGEGAPNYSATLYANNYSKNDMHIVREHMSDRNKVAAIKALRDCFSPMLGLREAKDIVETFWPS
jgi:ribosomal protein L7/L12